MLLVANGRSVNQNSQILVSLMAGAQTKEESALITNLESVSPELLWKVVFGAT